MGIEKVDVCLFFFPVPTTKSPRKAGGFSHLGKTFPRHFFSGYLFLHILHPLPEQEIISASPTPLEQSFSLTVYFLPK
jgi:hypothetical protein